MDSADKEFVDKLVSIMEPSNKTGTDSTSSTGNNSQTFDINDPEYMDFIMKQIIDGKVSIDTNNFAEPETSVETPTQTVQADVQPPAPVSSVNVSAQTFLPDVQPPAPVASGSVSQPINFKNSVVSGLNFSSNKAHTSITLPGVTASYMANGQRMFIPLNPMGTIPVIVYPDVATGTTTTGLSNESAPTADISPVTTASGLSAESASIADITLVAAASGPSGGTKRKLYEEDEFDDPVMEEKRKRAVNARNHRIKIKQKMEDLTTQLRETEEERDRFKSENEQMKKQLANFAKEISTLKQENAKLKQECETAREMAAQQDKIGVTHPNNTDLFAELFGNFSSY